MTNIVPAPRQIVIHCDDVASSHSANVAFVELSEMGACTSGSVMVPCPWFPEIAEIARNKPELDLGVHLTLNAEMPGFRWRPLTGVRANGLCDAEGFMWRDVKSAREADPAAVEWELRAQIEAALDAGIDVTHLDSHMGTVMMPEFLDIYLQLAADYRLPILLPRNIVEFAGPGINAEDNWPRYEAAFAELVGNNNPDFSRMITTAFGNTDPDTAAVYRKIVEGAGDGLIWGAFHFCAPGDVEATSPDAAIRTAEYELFRSGRAGELIAEARYEPVGMRAFRDRRRGTA